MAYRLSYVVNTDLVEVFAEDELELVESILDMERDVGKICFGVKIEAMQTPEDYVRKDRTMVLQRIQRFATILKEDLEREMKKRK
jgi:hypothetical protein